VGHFRNRRGVDRLTRSLADFAKIVEVFDASGVSFVSVTQAFNTTTSMGRLTLNVLLSFAQFEREASSIARTASPRPTRYW
jgi:DNA invertase Pin-like site-specific DNA recombinase